MLCVCFFFCKRSQIFPILYSFHSSLLHHQFQFYVKLLQLVQCSYPVILLFCCELWRHFMSFSSKVIIHWKGQLCPFRVAWQRNQRQATRAILSLACLWHIDLNVLPSHVTTIVWSWCAWPRYKCYIIDFQLPFPTCCGVRFRRYWNVVCACHSSAASSFRARHCCIRKSLQSLFCCHLWPSSHISRIVRKWIYGTMCDGRKGAVKSYTLLKVNKDNDYV